MALSENSPYLRDSWVREKLRGPPGYGRMRLLVQDSLRLMAGFESDGSADQSVSGVENHPFQAGAHLLL